MSDHPIQSVAVNHPGRTGRPIPSGGKTWTRRVVLQSVADATTAPLDENRLRSKVRYVLSKIDRGGGNCLKSATDTVVENLARSKKIFAKKIGWLAKKV